MKKIALVLLAISIIGCGSKREISKDEEILSLRKKVDSLKFEISDLDQQIEILQEAISVREGEISYWGHKYDSLKIIIEGERK